MDTFILFIRKYMVVWKSADVNQWLFHSFCLKIIICSWIPDVLLPVLTDGLFGLCFRPQTQTQTPSQCLGSVQSQASSLAYHLSRYPSFNDQHLTKDAFYSHHHPAAHHSSNSSNCSLTPYGSAGRTASGYSSGSDPVQTEPGLEAQRAAQILDSADGFGFVGAGLNPTGGGCQGQTYSAAGHSGKKDSDWWLNDL